MRLVRNILPTVSQAFLGLIILMLANNIFFYHEHDLDTGETVRHAHPFLSEEDEQQRDHSENELILLDLVTHAQYFLPDRVNFIEKICISFSISSVVYLADSPSLACDQVLSLRGPPLFLG
jgi:hypothetical protein